MNLKEKVRLYVSLTRLIDRLDYAADLHCDKSDGPINEAIDDLASIRDSLGLEGMDAE